jgi:hypothetical protein
MSRAGWNPAALGWWIAAFVLVLSHELAGFDNEVAVVEPVHEAVIVAAEGWDAPLSRWQLARAWGTWPAWCAALPIASLITWLASGIAVRGQSWLAGFVVVALSLSVNTNHLVPAVLVVLTARHLADSRMASRPFRMLSVALVLSAAAMLVTIEFGLVILTVILAVVVASYDDFVNHRRILTATSVAAALCVGIMLFACWWHPPFRHALLRPMSCAWYAIDLLIVPHLHPPFRRASEWIGVVCLLILVVRIVMARRGEFSPAAQPLALFLGTIGLVSSVNLWLSLIGLSAVLSVRAVKQHRTSTGPLPAALAPIVCILIATAHLVGTKMQLGGGLAEPAMTVRLVDHESWNVEGAVLLTNLSQSGDWKSTTRPLSTSLLLDDRWDVAGEQLLQYTAVCNDVLEGRQHSYRRSDGSWGGYAQFFDQWNPALIVIDSDQLQAIRLFSVDPAWNILSIDAKRTIFGSTSNSQTRLRAKNAADLFYFLEWPNSRRRVSAEGTLELGTDADARQVAAVLNAIRLPYAALRVLPTDDHPETDYARAWSYTELAHRALRQTGQWSLIDQFRATRRLQQLVSTGRLNLEQRTLVKNRLASLENETTLSPTSPTHEVSNSDALFSAAEMKIRRSLASGDSTAASLLMQELQQPSVRDFYSAIEWLNALSIDDVAVRLIEVAENSETPVRLREEAFFYLGCLALERRQPDEALGYLERSRKTRERSHLSALRNLYLLQLGGP